MAQHGYLHDKYDRDDFGRGDDDRSRSERNNEREWRGREAGSHDREHDRGAMFGGWDDHERLPSDRHQDDRGFFDRAGSEMSSWTGGNRDHRDHRDHGQDRGCGSSQQRDWGQGGREHSAFSSQGGQSGQRYSAHPDDHYCSWRDKQMQALDRDYQDYCREREQQFHSDFDTWRSNRQGQAQSSTAQQGAGTNSTQGSTSHSQGSELSNDAMERDQEANRGGEIEGATASPMGAATMGTSNSENTTSAPGATGRGRR